MDVVELFGLKGIQHTPISIKNARVSQVSWTWFRCLLEPLDGTEPGAEQLLHTCS